MNVTEILETCNKNSIHISKAGDNIKVSGDKDKLTPELREALKKNKQEILKLLSLKETTIFDDYSQGKNIPPIKALTNRRHLSIPLSVAQQRLWFIDKLEGSSAQYNRSIVLRLRGKLNIAVVSQTFSALVERHEVLRTVYKMNTNGDVEQIVLAPVGAPIIEEDLSSLNKDEQESMVKKKVLQEVQNAFDLSTDLMLRVQILPLEEAEYVLLITLHGIASDMQSLAILQQDFERLYTAFSQDKPNPLQPLPIQYADYALWQRQWLQEKNLELHINYWREQLRDLPTTHGLPLDYPRQPQRQFNVKTYQHKITSAITDKLQTLSSKEEVTLFMVTYAAFAVLLSRWSNETDIVVGTPVANRTHVEMDEMIGLFANTIVMRTNCVGNSSFADLLKQVKEQFLSHHLHQHIPFETLVDELRPLRTAAHNPLFQILYSMNEEEPSNNDEIDGEKGQSEKFVKTSDLFSFSSPYDLTVSVAKDSNCLTTLWSYDANIFKLKTIKNLAEHYENLLLACTMRPDTTLQQLPILSEQEKNNLLTKWNSQSKPTSDSVCIHELFESQVKKSPNGTAVVFKGEEITYEELNQRSNRLARHLIEMGVRPDSIVGLCTKRSINMIVGLLGILKAGGAYLPLDPDYPEARLRLMLEDAQCSIVLSQSYLRGSLPVNDKQTVLYLDDEVALDQLNNHQSCNLTQQERQQQQLTSRHLAYVIYTSGSTGRPKGVMIEHCSVVNLITNASYASLSEETVFLHHSSISFDAATLEIWGSLLVGGKLVCFSGSSYDLNELEEHVRTYRINTLWLTSALFDQLCTKKLDGLNTLLVGGDIVKPESVISWYKNNHCCQLVNGYGPTENTTFTCCYSIPKDLSDVSSIPIGRPLNNTEIYILSPAQAPCPIGVVGELFVGGSGVARGYLNQAELTAERFISNPFRENPHARLYKTGDLVRWLPDAEGRPDNLVFIGRADRQVKIRGYRIECGEIESFINAHEIIEGSVVTVREDTPGEKSLVAYLVKARREESQTATDDQVINTLRDHLKKLLPGYMIPNAFLVLEKFPITHNGKLDLGALPAPGSCCSDEEISSPKTTTEEILLPLWEQVLNRKPISTTASFFDLGGHSIRALKLVALIQNELGWEVSLSALFENPTIQQLSIWCEINIEPMQVSPHRLWYLDKLEEGHTQYNQPIALNLEGNVNYQTLGDTLAVLKRNRGIISSNVNVEGAGRVLDCDDLSHSSRLEQIETIRTEAAFESSMQHEMESESWLRIRLFRLNDNEHVLLLTVPINTSTEWSAIEDEIAKIYHNSPGTA